jgi:hypothetical protein
MDRFGIRIHHWVEEYPELIVFMFFWHDTAPSIEKFRALGFWCEHC